MHLIQAPAFQASIDRHLPKREPLKQTPRASRKASTPKAARKAKASKAAPKKQAPKKTAWKKALLAEIRSGVAYADSGCGDVPMAELRAWASSRWGVKGRSKAQIYNRIQNN